MISVVLAVFNEERNIERCLKSVLDFTDEIVIVDGSSTDKTGEIAKKLGAKVIKTTNKPIFHINKQMAIDEAQGNLILQLDADEVVDQDLANFIKKLDCRMKDESSAVYESAWWIKRKNNFLGHWFKKGAQYPDPVIRLFIKNKAWLPQKSVHEQMKVDGKIGWAEGHLLHYSNPRLKDYLRKLNTYTSLEAQKLRQENQKVTPKLVVSHLLILPLKTFLSLFVRHKGFFDGLYGFLFAFLSACHFPVILYKLIMQRQ